MLRINKEYSKEEILKICGEREDVLVSARAHQKRFKSKVLKNYIEAIDGIHKKHNSSNRIKGLMFELNRNVITKKTIMMEVI